MWIQHPSYITNKTTLVLGLLAILVLGGVSAMSPQTHSAAVTDATSGSCKDFWNCILPTQIQKSADYLERNRNGKLYTEDPRTITPYSEKVRLTYVTQAGGYLNLYRLKHDTMNMLYAKMRLDYLVLIGKQGLSPGPFDGMEAYILLQGSELFPSKPEYRSFGLQITDSCLTYDLILDPGFMCDMALAKAYRLTGQEKYLVKMRASTAATSPMQFDNGGWPHWNQNAGPSANYTAWMIEEAYLMRHGDQTNPDLDTNILRARSFLLGRVNADGSVSAYPGEPDSVGMSTLSSIAYDFQGLGDTAVAQQVLNFLFAHQFKGADSGAYPDLWIDTNLSDLWTASQPSILRTSLIFWDLSNILLDRATRLCVSGTASTCTITPDNCSPAYAQLGACTLNYPGTDTCLNGQQTKCLNTSLITYDTHALCGQTTIACSPNDYSCWNECGNPGIKKCIGASCGSCVSWDTRDTICELMCSETPPAQCQQ